MARNHYGILGVEPDASEEEIKSAYRRAAKRVHPDHAGGGCEPFRAVRDAYDVLIDPARRRDYDNQLARERHSIAVRHRPAPEPLRRVQVPAEPLVPTEQRAAGGSLWDWLDELAARTSVRAYPGQMGGSGPLQAAPVLGEVEVRLDAYQARRGGMLRLWVPVRTVCPGCEGAGGVAFYACPHCAGRGDVVREIAIEIEFPAGVGDGSVGRVPLDRVGMPGRMLILRFRVRGW